MNQYNPIAFTKYGISGISPYGRSDPAYVGRFGPQALRTDAYAENTRLLREVLAPYPARQSISDQIFGSQLQAQKFSLEHLTGSLGQRHTLHERHIRDIQDKLALVQEQLSITSMLYGNLMDRNRVQLVRLACQLEQQKRDEELALWKDRADVMKMLLEAALQYHDVTRRASLLSSLEVGYGQPE